MKKLIEELKIELNEIEKLKADYIEKNKLFGESSFNEGAINAIDNVTNHIKRAIARAEHPNEVKQLQYWIGCLCESYKCNNHITFDAIAEQVVYEMFLGNAKEEGD